MYKQAHTLLHLWYQENGRHSLPWRHTDDAYKIWVSEIMLQQTQVRTVLERFYFPFLETFPSLEVLAQASEDEVLKKWEGLGYYSRARNLHKTAILTKTTLPTTVKELIALPGIGKSTAHAIASFAYKQNVPILDANVKRILYRLFAIKNCSEKELWQKAYAFVDTDNTYDFNQALMDLGSSVCTGKKALCEVCPFVLVCKGKETPFTFPEKKAKKITPIREKQIIIHFFEGKYALKRRETHLLNGLWGFCEYDKKVNINNTQHLGKIKHTYSHFKLHAEVHLHKAYIADHEWFSVQEIKDLALSTADHKAFALLDMSKKEIYSKV